MKCEKCKKNEATFFYEETVNGKTRSYRLCADCAKALQQSGEIPTAGFDTAPYPFFEDISPFPDLLGGLFGLPAAAPRQKNRKTCPACGATWEDLAANGKVSCPKCYETFADELQGTLRSLHGNVTHTGRAPAARRAKQEKADKLAELKAELKAAVEAENFEKAASLRDEIRGMEA